MLSVTCTILATKLCHSINFVPTKALLKDTELFAESRLPLLAFCAYMQVLFAWNTYSVLRWTSSFLAKFSSYKQTRIEDPILKFRFGINRIISAFSIKLQYINGTVKNSHRGTERRQGRQRRHPSMMSFGTYIQNEPFEESPCMQSWLKLIHL